jgi:hypothetical protein
MFSSTQQRAVRYAIRQKWYLYYVPTGLWRVFMLVFYQYFVPNGTLNY